MPRTNTGTFMAFQNIRLSGMGSMTLPKAIAASLDEIEAKTIAGDEFPFAGSWVDEVASLFNTTLDDLGYRPNGNHLAGRNVESELLAGRAALILFRDNEQQDAALRAAVIPEIAKIEQQIQRRDFIKPLRDPEWGADILEFVTRMAPHETFSLDESTGLYIARTVTFKLETLHAEIDANGEVCVWIYEES